MPTVTVYTAEGCSLCERALEVVRDVQGAFGFPLEVVDIEGDSELEARYRERLPAIEIDGNPAFEHFVTAEALRERLDPH